MALSERKSATRKNSKAKAIKPKLSYDVVISESDKHQLALSIGLNLYSDSDRYGWILEQLLSSEMPSGYEKERDIEGNLVFYNRLQNTTSKMHPNHLEYRRLLTNSIQ